MAPSWWDRRLLSLQRSSASHSNREVCFRLWGSEVKVGWREREDRRKERETTKSTFNVNTCTCSTHDLMYLLGPQNTCIVPWIASIVLGSEPPSAWRNLGKLTGLSDPMSIPIISTFTWEIRLMWLHIPHWYSWPGPTERLDTALGHCRSDQRECWGA